MDWQIVINIAAAVVLAIVGGYIRFVQAQQGEERQRREALDLRLSDFQIKVAEKYVTHDDIRRIEDALIRIEAKIDVKADK